MIEQLLQSVKIPFKLIDEDKGFKLVKVNSKLHILYLYGKGNRFLMERDFFEYIDGNSIPYSILLLSINVNISLITFPLLMKLTEKTAFD